MSFCRITGKSRGLPKPNYFPLLPPISPADAKRFCRITGKSYGLPSHHYIPVVTVKKTKKRKQCHITTSSEGNEKHSFAPESQESNKKRHVVMSEYRYVFPVLDDACESQKTLTEILSTKKEIEENKKFVYTVEERRCSLVFPAQLEAAVRDGDVRDVMLAKDSDTVMFKLKQGKNVSIDVKDVPVTKEELWEGEGPNEEVVKEREKEDSSKKKKRKRTEGLTSMTKIFEEKERVADIEEEKMAQIIEAKKAKVMEVNGKKDEDESWDRFDPGHFRADASLVMCSGDWRDLLKPLIEDWDWDSFEQEAAASEGVPVVATLPKPLSAKPEVLDLSESLPGNIQQQLPAISEETGGFQPITAVTPFTPLIAEPEPDVQHAIKSLSPQDLAKTEDFKKVFKEESKAQMLPDIEDIPEVMAKLESGIKTEIGEEKGPRVHGLMLDIAAAQKFVAGQTVDTPRGPVFVPGQTLQTPSGPTFMPGLTVLTPDGPMLIPGQKVMSEDKNGVITPVFVAGQTLNTREGEKFVAGQTIHSAEGSRFVPGQTVFTPEGPKFVAGQVIVEKPKESAEGVTANPTPRFVPGQTVMTASGPQFVPGQTVINPQGESVFIPGQSIKTETAWEFVPGQSMKTEEGDVKFIAGQTIVTEEGPKFIPGRTVNVDSNAPPQFVPGITVEKNDGSISFVPGKTVQTPQGPKFLEGQILQTATGSMFVPGKTSVSDDGVSLVKFAMAKTIDEVVVSAPKVEGLRINPVTANALPADKSEAVFGHMVQTAHRVEFYPGQAPALHSGKVVPGRLIHGEEGEVRFVPGIIAEEGKFVPGQVVMTEKGEQFVPGQVVETSDGPKFVPGQVVVTRTGPKFVPGQTVDTPDGPRFVPGQIVETKAGPTFIPGQVISTEEEGCRFVPGQVVDTAEGPRFVPGRVVETGDRVTFVPGQVVETKEGLRFVAPDLQDDSEGGFEFSVQGFEVTPEELRLLRPHLVASSYPAAGGEMTIDSRMLRQLSDAGMAVGRQVPTVIPGVDVRTQEAFLSSEVVMNLTDKLGITGVSAVKMGDVLAMVVRIGSEVLQQQKGSITKLDPTKMSAKILESMKKCGVGQIKKGEESLKEFVQTLVSAVVLTASQSTSDDENSQEAVIASIGPVFDELLKDVFELQPGSKDRAASALVESLHNYLVLPGNVSNLRANTAEILRIERQNNKVNILKNLVKEEANEVVTEKFNAVLKNTEGHQRESIMGEAFKHLSQRKPELIGKVLEKVYKSVGDVNTEKDATETLQRAIVSAVRENSELQLQELMTEKVDDEELKTLVLQAVGLARALGMYDAASGLMEILADPTSSLVLATDREALSILKRLTVMRQLAGERPNFTTALKQLQTDPYTARSDPQLKELVRESAALMVVPEETLPLQSSADIPLALLHADNSLAMEDFLVTTNRRQGPLLILKHGIQAIIPREAARDVLTGQVAYTVLDENGIRHFEPLHVFSALRLPRMYTHRFSMYCCAMVEQDTTATSTMSPTSSVEDISEARRNSDLTTTSDTKRYSTADTRSWARPWGSLPSSDTLTTTSKRFYTASGDSSPSYKRYRGSLSSSLWSGDVTPTRTPFSEVSRLVNVMSINSLAPRRNSAISPVSSRRKVLQPESLMLIKSLRGSSLRSLLYSDRIRNRIIRDYLCSL